MRHCIGGNRLSVIVREIYTVEICTILTLSFRMDQGQMLMPIESKYMTFSLMVKIIFVLSAKVNEILIIEIWMNLTLTFRMGEGQMKIYQLKVNRWILGKRMFALPVTVYEIKIMFNLSKWFVFECMVFKSMPISRVTTSSNTSFDGVLKA